MAKRKPTHVVYFVRDIGAEKPMWQRIGVAWEHQSGEGFNIKFEFAPVDYSAGDIVMLKASEKPGDGEQEAA